MTDDADPDVTLDDPADLLSESADIYRLKNDSYGDAWRLAPKTLAMWLEEFDQDGVEIEAEPWELTSFGLYNRRLEKLIRAFHAEFVSKDADIDFESVTDSHVDCAPYASMHAVATSHSLHDEPGSEASDDGCDQDHERWARSGWNFCPRCGTNIRR